jgi:hypothetical protein
MKVLLNEGTLGGGRVIPQFSRSRAMKTRTALRNRMALKARMVIKAESARERKCDGNRF